MNVTPLRAVRLAGLVLVALCALSSSAAAKGPQQAYRASPPAGVSTSSSSVSDTQCPCNAGLPRTSVASASSPAECPCNAGLPDGPSGVLSARVARQTMAPADAVGNSSVSDVQCPCNAGLPVGQAATISPQQCPCNVAGGPPGGLPELLRTTGSDAARSASAIPAGQFGVVHPLANQSSRTFEWGDASVGAAVTAGIGLLILGAASLFGRRRVRGRLPAS
jgi:hypothetical protein